MKLYTGMRPLFSTTALILCGALMAGASLAVAQQPSGDLVGGSSMLFKPQNPETHSKHKQKYNVPARSAAKSHARQVARLSATDVRERVEDALDEGNEARDAHNYAGAEQAYRDALKLAAHEARAAYGLGNVYVDQQRWDEAERAYRAAIASDPGNAGAWVALSFVLAQPRVNGNSVQRLLDAETAARRATQLQPNNAFAFDRLGEALKARGILNDETEQAYRRAIELDPQYAVYYIHLAAALRKMKRETEAAPLYKKAEELAQDAPTLVFLADALQSEQLWDRSEPILRRALSLDARNTGALFLLGRMLVVSKRYTEAEPLLKGVIEITPRSFVPYLVLGSAYLQMERYEDAERIFNRSVEFTSSREHKQLADVFGFRGVGDGYLKAGRQRDALRAYQRALEFDPNNAELQDKIAATRAQ